MQGSGLWREFITRRKRLIKKSALIKAGRDFGICLKWRYKGNLFWSVLFSWSNGYSLRFLIKNKWFICGTACFECYPPFNIAPCERFVQRKFGSGETIEKSAHGCYNLCKRRKSECWMRGRLRRLSARCARGPLEVPVIVKTSGWGPTRSTGYGRNEWMRAHSKQLFYRKWVGENPLESRKNLKTSGSAPTQNANLYENEWNPAHSNITFFPNEWAYSLRRITYIGRKLPSSISFLVFCGNFHPLDLCFL